MTGVTAIACGVFTAELRYLESTGFIQFPVRYLDSMLHMRPRQLKEELEDAIRRERAQGNRVLVLFGDCHPRIVDQTEGADIVRIPGDNCIAILMGRERYRNLRQNRSFVLMADWALRWREVFETELGLTEETAPLFMNEHHTEIVYVDTGIAPVPAQALQDCAQFCGLPFRVERLPLEELKRAITEALARLED